MYTNKTYKMLTSRSKVIYPCNKMIFIRAKGLSSPIEAVLDIHV